VASEQDLQRDLKEAMKARDMNRVYVLRGLLAAIKNVKVDKRVAELPEADLTALVRKELNKRLEAIGYAEKAGRGETVAQNEAEKDVLEAYLPPQMDEGELEKVVRALADELGTTQIGPLMAALRERHAGRFDGRLASQVIRKLQA
jgi:uncharacterized protein YqeY